MSGANAFVFTITALDKATATIRHIKSEFKTEFGQMVSPVTQVTSSLADLSRETGLTSIATHAESALGHVMRLGGGIEHALLAPLKAVGGLSAGLGALAGAGSIFGLIEMVKHGSESMNELYEGSEKTGVSIRQLARLHYFGEQNGTDIGAMDKALIQFNRVIAQVASGKNKEAAGYLSRMHLSIWNTNHTLKDAGDLLPKVADQFQHNGSIVQKTGASYAFFKKSAANMIVVMKGGGGAIMRAGDHFEHLHGKVTEAEGLIAHQAIIAWKNLDAATSGLSDSIGIALAPAITSVITPLTELIARNRDVIKQDVGKWARETADWLLKIDWKKVGMDATAVMNGLSFAVHGVAVAFDDLEKSGEWFQRNSWWMSKALHLNPVTAIPITIGEMAYAGKFSAHKAIRALPVFGQVLTVADMFGGDGDATKQPVSGGHSRPLRSSPIDFREPILGRGEGGQAASFWEDLRSEIRKTGTVNIKVDFTNVPQGLQVHTDHYGKAIDQFDRGMAWANP